MLDARAGCHKTHSSKSRPESAGMLQLVPVAAEVLELRCVETQEIKLHEVEGSQ